MKERPILFNTEMVHAILDGRKTQTRRVIKLKDFQVAESPGYDFMFRDKRSLWNEVTIERLLAKWFLYGTKGDQLWVREAFRIVGWHDGEPYLIEYKDGVQLEEPGDSSSYDNEKYIKYWNQCSEDCEKAGVELDFETNLYLTDEHGSVPTRWRPSIFMPRWASRIQLEVKNIRVERVQEITLEDVVAEGIKHTFPQVDIDRFKVLWNSINEKRGYGWEKNPWVWVVEFERINQ